MKSAPREAPASATKSGRPDGYDGGPIRVDPDNTSDRSKVAGFDQLAVGDGREASAPSHIRLPAAVVKSLDEAWRESLATDKEQGGNVVRTYGGDYKVKRTHDKDDDATTYHSDPSNVGRLDHHVGVVHTHRQDKDSPDYETFSDVDMASIVDEEQPLNILRSGNQTYMIARTKEFDALIDKRNDPEKLTQLKIAITDTYNAAYQAEKAAGGGRPSRVEAGVIAVCRKFHLIYYWGQGQDLHRVR